MEKPDALAYYHGKERYNCAQAIVKAFAPSVGVEDVCLKPLVHFGGGRAPEGECGALFAAKALFQDDPTARQRIEQEFVRAAGSRKCREIRKGKQFTCQQCVQTAAEAVWIRLGDGHIPRRPAECNGQGIQSTTNFLEKEK